MCNMQGGYSKYECHRLIYYFTIFYRLLALRTVDIKLSFKSTLSPLNIWPVDFVRDNSGVEPYQ